MPLELAQVTSDADFDQLIPLLWRSYSQPRVPWLWLTFAVVDGSDDELRKAGIAKSKDFYLNAHRSDPSSRWLKVTDSDTGRIVAGSRWHFYAEGSDDPFEGKPLPKIEVSSWPEGDRREYANATFRQFLGARRERYKGPYAGPQVFFVHPEYRRRGAASMMLDWGLARTDELRLQSFIESTAWAVAFYKTRGYVVVKVDHIDPQTPEPSADWKFMQETFGSMDLFCMWRPVDGKYVPEEMPLPF